MYRFNFSITAILFFFFKSTFSHRPSTARRPSTRMQRVDVLKTVHSRQYRSSSCTPHDFVFSNFRRRGKNRPKLAIRSYDPVTIAPARTHLRIDRRKPRTECRDRTATFGWPLPASSGPWGTASRPFRTLAPSTCKWHGCKTTQRPVKRYIAYCCLSVIGTG